MDICNITITDELIRLFESIFPEVFVTITNDNKNSKSELMNGIAGNQSHWFGIKDNNKIIAFCTIAHIQNYIILYNVGVDSKYRNKEYGSKMIKYIINNFGLEKICLFVKKTNRPAIKLYRKFYFEYADNAFQPPAGYICMVRSTNTH